MSKPALSTLVMAVAMTLSPLALAENSESEATSEDLALAQAENEIPAAVTAYMQYIDDLDRRYPDSSAVDIDRFLIEEGETAALKYCNAIGIDGPCVIEGQGGQQHFVRAQRGPQGTNGPDDWWGWIYNHLYNVGVIPDKDQCPAPFERVEIYMDDENSRNANRRDGWIGATVSGSDTAWRFCRLDTKNSLAYLPLPFSGNEYDYAVLNMGLFCPSGARRVKRYQDNQDGRDTNGNGSSGDIYPNVSVGSGNWITYTCHFDGAAQSYLGWMTGGWPNLGFSYGVFGSYRLPFRLAKGWVFQDDEDNRNQNYWDGSPDEVMGDSRNTIRYLSKVR
jgi:hypothetical protein